MIHIDVHITKFNKPNIIFFSIFCAFLWLQNLLKFQIGNVIFYVFIGHIGHIGHNLNFALILGDTMPDRNRDWQVNMRFNNFDLFSLFFIEFSRNHLFKTILAMNSFMLWQKETSRGMKREGQKLLNIFKNIFISTES